ncbi:hypothetical protein [Reyranella sp.]|uniref:hypothetical protein n=1 Tax=Reyranella sp. TaxID=1929291 RepID=UPI003C7D0114
MTDRRPPLTLAGGDVMLTARLPDGRAVAVFLDREGKRTPFSQPAQCFELRGIGWHLAEIKALIAGLPLQGARPVAPVSPTEADAPQPRGFLHAHHTAAED